MELDHEQKVKETRYSYKMSKEEFVEKMGIEKVSEDRIGDCSAVVNLVENQVVVQLTILDE